MPPAIAAAGIGAGATLGAAFIGSNAAKAASERQYGAAMSALGLQRDMFNTVQQGVAPYMGVGSNAAATLSSIYGWGGPGSPAGAPGATAPNWQAFVGTPDYQFTLEQGQRALDMSAASKHLLGTGGMVRASQEFGQGLAGTQFGNVIQRLMAMMSLGSGAAGTLGQTAGQFGNMMGQSTMAGGTAQASGIVGQANPWINALNMGPGNALAMYQFGQQNFPSTWGSMMPGSPAGNPMSINPSAYAAPPGYNPMNLSSPA